MCIVVLQLGAGGVAHRIMRLQRVCSPAASTSTFIALALLTPLYEELIYRGALSSVFANRMNSSSRACCAVVPALFFAAMHNSSNLNAAELLHHYAFGCCVGARFSRGFHVARRLHSHRAQRGCGVRSNRCHSRRCISGACHRCLRCLRLCQFAAPATLKVTSW